MGCLGLNFPIFVNIELLWFGPRQMRRRKGKGAADVDRFKNSGSSLTPWERS